jgi:hypothetical protein
MKRKNRMTAIYKKQVRRTFSLALTAVMTVAALLPGVVPQTALAYGLPTNRAIMMSNSAVSATNTIYTLSFATDQEGANLAMEGLVVDFCGAGVNDSPIIGDTNCTGPTGLNTNFATLVLANQTGITGWSVDTTNSTASKLVLTRTSSVVNTATAFSIDLGTAANGITNPSSLGTFYARVLTFTTAAGAQQYVSNDIDNGGANVVNDAGGIALSTANQITIQSKVQERLTFCIYTTGVGCPGSISSPTLLGDANGVLDPGIAYTTATSTNGNPKFGLASNAAGNVVINMKGGTLKRTVGCADGTGQPCSINPIGGTATASTVSTEQFGVRLTGLGGNITATTPYDDGANYAFDDNNTTGTQSTYGDQIASMVASAEQQGQMQFVGNISNTTESGIYTTTLTFIATGTY